MNCMNRGTVGSLVDIANIVQDLNHGTQIIVVDEIVFHTSITAFFLLELLVTYAQRVSTWYTLSIFT